MFLFGGTLTKLLAVLTAVMTVVGGMPHVQCVCPDGGVKLNCAGAANGCCCAASADSGDSSLPCCLHPAGSYPTRAKSDGLVIGQKVCGCERSLVAESAPVVVIDHADVQIPVYATTASEWVTTLVSDAQAHFTRAERRCIAPPA